MRRYFRTVLWILSAGFTLIVVALRADIVAIPAPLVEAPPPAPPIVSRAVPPADQMTGATPKGTVLYSIGQPTDEEQLYLEYINRARTNPPAPADSPLVAALEPDEPVRRMSIRQNLCGCSSGWG